MARNNRINGIQQRAEKKARQKADLAAQRAKKSKAKGKGQKLAKAKKATKGSNTRPSRSAVIREPPLNSPLQEPDANASTNNDEPSDCSQPVPPHKKRRRDHVAVTNIANGSNVIQPRSDSSDEGDDLPSTLSPDDPEHFCKLSMAVRFWMHRSITESDIEMGQKFMESYLGLLTSVCCPSCSHDK